MRKHVDKIKRELVGKTTGYVLAGFGFVAALAWNDAIKSLIEFFFPIEKSGLILKFTYAAILTVIVAIIGIITVHWSEEKKE